MHQRTEVTRLDWGLSGIAMGVSDRTRDGLLEYDRQTSQAKIRHGALSKATFDEVIDERHAPPSGIESCDSSPTARMARGELRRAMGKQHYREAFDAVLPHLEKLARSLVVDGEEGAITCSTQSSPVNRVHPRKGQFRRGEPGVHR